MIVRVRVLIPNNSGIIGTGYLRKRREKKMAIKLILSAKDKETMFAAMRERAEKIEANKPISKEDQEELKRLEAIIFQIAFAKDVA